MPFLHGLRLQVVATLLSRFRFELAPEVTACAADAVLTYLKVHALKHPKGCSNDEPKEKPFAMMLDDFGQMGGAKGVYAAEHMAMTLQLDGGLLMRYWPRGEV